MNTESILYATWLIPYFCFLFIFAMIIIFKYKNIKQYIENDKRTLNIFTILIYTYYYYIKDNFYNEDSHDDYSEIEFFIVLCIVFILPIANIYCLFRFLFRFTYNTVKQIKI